MMDITASTLFKTEGPFAPFLVCATLTGPGAGTRTIRVELIVSGKGGENNVNKPENDVIFSYYRASRHSRPS